MGVRKTGGEKMAEYLFGDVRGFWSQKELSEYNERKIKLFVDKKCLNYLQYCNLFCYYWKNEKCVNRY